MPLLVLLHLVFLISFVLFSQEIVTNIAITNIPTPKYSCSTILKSEFEKNTLSIKEEKNLNIIPVPTSVMKEPTNLLGNLSSISFFFYITFIKHPNNRIY